MIDLASDEVAVPIPGYERYSVTSHGRVWSEARGGRFLSGGINGEGYRVVLLYDGSGRRITSAVHRLVAQAFVPNPDGLETVNHKDTNKDNNRSSNLEWLTRVDNLVHAQEAGLLHKTSSQYHGVTFIQKPSNQNKPWMARCSDASGRTKYLGLYITERAAAQAYNDYVVQHGLSRPLNILAEVQ